MTDSTADSTETVPVATYTGPSPFITATEDVPSPSTDSFGAGMGPFGPDVPVADSDGGPTASEPAGYTPDFAALQAANAEPSVFGHELHELIGHLTGKWIDENTITGWFTLLATQVQSRAYRHAVFTIANTEVPSQVAGDPALNVLDFRDDLATTLRRAFAL